MAKHLEDREFFEDDEEGRAFLAYYDAVEEADDTLIGFIEPYGLPPGVEEHGGIIAVYNECIEKNVTWQKLLDFKPLQHDDDII